MLDVASPVAPRIATITVITKKSRTSIFDRVRLLADQRQLNRFDPRRQGGARCLNILGLVRSRRKGLRRSAPNRRREDQRRHGDSGAV
jgi:hypothetical protein